MSPLARRLTSWAEKPAELQPLTPTASRSKVATIEFRVTRGAAALLPVGSGGAKEGWRLMMHAFLVMASCMFLGCFSC